MSKTATQTKQVSPERQQQQQQQTASEDLRRSYDNKPLTLKKSLIKKFLAKLNIQRKVPLHPEAQKICDQFKKDPLMQSTLALYKVGKVLGQGGFGRVNLGLQRMTRKLVAIKSIKTKGVAYENERRKIW